MTADEARELFSAAYDGELAAAEQAAFEAALAADATLRAEYDELRAVLDEAHRLELADDEAPPDLLVGVQTRLRARSRGRYYRDRFAERAGPKALTPLIVASVMLLIVAVAWLSLYYVHVEGPPSGGVGEATTQDRP